MPTSYPANIDAIPDAPPGNVPLGASAPKHTEAHQKLADVANAIQQTLGENPQGAAASVAARLDGLPAAINLRGLLSARPAASAANLGFRYTTTDVGNEFTARSDGAAWNVEPTFPVCETKTADFTAVAGVRYFLDASANTVTATLPASPALNDHVPLLAINTTYTISVARNGERLCGGTEDLTFDNAGDGVVLVFTPDGWWPEGELSRNTQPVPMTAADLAFAPTASIPATNTQSAIEQADENAMVYAMIFGG